LKIAIYWEQQDWGGVDSHLLTLLSTWPDPTDKFVLFYNKGNLGFQRIKEDLRKIENIKFSEVSSYSYNVIMSKLSESKLFRWLRPLVYFLQPVLFVLMIIRLKLAFKADQKFDVLLANNGGYPAAWGCLSAIIAAKKIGINIRLLLIHHEATRPNMFMSWYERLIDRLVISSSSTIVCPSYATRQTLLERRWFMANSIRMRVIYNTVQENTIPASEDLPQAANIRKLINDDTAVLVGIVGRIEPYKGHEDIIFAISRLSDENKKKVKLVIVGAGNNDEIHRLKSLAKKFSVSDNVIFLGYINGSSIDIISQLDLLVVATRSFEGFGLTIAESMVAGTPVLTTNVGAIPEILNSSVSTLVNPCTPRELSNAISDFLINKKNWIKKAELAQEHVKAIGSGMTEEYRRLILECDD